jgi:hypothetical protein
MSGTAEQHLQMAKLIRQKAMAFPADKRAQAIEQSNLFLALAADASKDRGGLDLRGFDFDALPPDWSDIDRQIAKLTPIKVDERKSKSSKQHAELWERIRFPPSGYRVFPSRWLVVSSQSMVICAERITGCQRSVLWRTTSAISSGVLP